MAGPLRWGGVGVGVRAGPSRKKELFLEPFFHRSKISTAIKLEGGGGQALMALRFFCGFPQELYGLPPPLSYVTVPFNYSLLVAFGSNKKWITLLSDESKFFALLGLYFVSRVIKINICLKLVNFPAHVFYVLS